MKAGKGIDKYTSQNETRPFLVDGDMPGKNLIINGNCQVTNHNTYTKNSGYGWVCDRWFREYNNITNPSVLMYRRTDTIREKFEIGTSQTLNGALLRDKHIVEVPPQYGINYEGKNMVLSFIASVNTAGVGNKVQIAIGFKGGATYGWLPDAPYYTFPAVTLTQETQHFEFPFSIPEKTFGLYAGGIVIYVVYAGNSTMGDKFPIDSFPMSGKTYIGEYQLEFGRKATPYEYRADSIEEELCRRYYERAPLWSVNDAVPYAVFNNGNIMTGAVRFLTRKRTAPTVTVYSDTNQAGTVNVHPANGGGVSGVTPPVGFHVNDSGFIWKAGAMASAGTAGSGVMRFDWEADAELY